MHPNIEIFPSWAGFDISDMTWTAPVSWHYNQQLSDLSHTFLDTIISLVADEYLSSQFASYDLFLQVWLQN